jgi:hypothetical protein
MREDFKYPYRVMTRTEEIEANNMDIKFIWKIFSYSYNISRYNFV